jgi:PAP2 superfamily protein
MQLWAAEWISLLAFSGLLLLARLRRDLSGTKRLKITALGAGGMAIALLVSLLLPAWIHPLAARVCRDWVPLLQILLFYHQAGEFVTGPNIRVEERLLRWDARFVAPPLKWCAHSGLGGLIFTCFEIAYLSYYPSLPLALAALYLEGHAREAGRFWAVVLLATYISFSVLPLLATRPPRVLSEKWSAQFPSGKMRAFNLWILRRGSIHANTCPSGHVAITAACALALLLTGPLWVGLGFVGIAMSIALGAVAGRYHYGPDAILGVLTAVFALAVALALPYVSGG